MKRETEADTNVIMKKNYSERGSMSGFARRRLR